MEPPGVVLEHHFDGRRVPLHRTADHLPTVVALEDQPLFVYSTDGGPAGEGVLTAKVEYLAAE